MLFVCYGMGRAQRMSGPVSVYLNQLDFSRQPLIDLYVTITDAQRDPVLLRPSDTLAFRIDHNGYQALPSDLQSVLSLKQKGQSELYIAMVFDNSASMSGRTGLLESAALQFIDSLKTGDNASIIDFGGDQQETKVPEFPEPIHARQRITFSNSKTFLRQKVKMTLLTQSTYMFDALMLSLSTLNTTNVLGRKAIVLFSDGEEIGSVCSLEDVERYLKAYDIPVYAIDLNTRRNTLLQTLALESGGEYFFVREPGDLVSLYQTVLKLLKSQYRVTYRSPEANISTNLYTINLSLQGRFKGQAKRTFSIDGENIAYFNLVYLESIGKQTIGTYLDYLAGFPRSKHVNDVQLRLGEFWEKRGDFAKAMGVYNVVLRYPTSTAYTEALLQKANLYQSAKQFVSAQKVYKQAITNERNPTVRAKAMLELAKAYTAEGNFSLALNTFSSLTSQYEGTDVASEAHLQAASLSMEMGDLPAAEKNLTQVVQVYGESKSAVFARMELAKIAEKTNRSDQAQKLYSEVANSTGDADLKDQAALKSASLQMKSGKAADAVSSLKQLVATGSSATVVSSAKTQLVAALMQAGQLTEARQLMQQLSPDAQADLKKEFSQIVVRGKNVSGTALPNGAFVAVMPSSSGGNPIKTIEWPEATQKFSAVGPVYTLAASPVPASASIPVRPDWLQKKIVKPGTSGIYRFVNGEWKSVPATLDKSGTAFDFTYSEPGIYALLALPPRVVRLYNIYFDLGQAVIRKEAERPLYQIIDDLKAVPDARLEISGHTDTTGSEQLNIELSSQRAAVIKNFMVQNGVEADRLIARGYGSRYPIAPNNSPENMQKNRRTEFTLIRPVVEPTGTESNVRNRYTVILKTYISLKDAYDDKTLYQNRGFDVMVITNEDKASERYELSLGIYDSETDAKAALAKFTAEFKGIEGQILVSKVSR
jgi:outer membrane protein OmpA-like peptidoglycan-associated protein